MIRVTMHAVDETSSKHDTVQATLPAEQYYYWHQDLCSLAEKLTIIIDEIPEP